MSRPTVADLTGDHPLALLARQTWLTKSLPPKTQQPETIQQLWEAVGTDEDPPYNLLLLEQLQALERYIWPTYNSDESSNQHVLLLALLINVKRQEHLPIWPLFAERPDEFSDLFRRVTHLTLDQSLSTRIRTQLLLFLVGAFQSLDSGLVRKECAPLVSIGIWQHLHSDAAREGLLAKSAQLQKAWRAAQKKIQGAGADAGRVRFERSWLCTLILDFLDKLYLESATAVQREETLRYSERFVELLCDLLSQLPTRRYVNTLLQDLHVVSVAKLSPLYQDGDDAALLREMLGLLEHYMHFPVDDQSGKQLNRVEADSAHNARIARLQNAALKLQPEKLKILVLANYGSLGQREELLGHLKALNDAELLELCKEIGSRTEYPEKSLVASDRLFLNEILVSTIEQRPSYTDTVRTTPILPTETALYDPPLLRTDDYDGSRPLPIPKVNLQYLTLGDFLWRSFTLYRSEAFYGLRKHLEDTLKRLQLRLLGTQTKFEGFSRMAIPISKPAIIEVLPPRVGEEAPAEVKVEVILDVSRLQPGLRREWESLRQDDVVFLLAVQAAETAKRLTLTNGHAAGSGKVGIKMLRCAEVISVLDESGRVLRAGQDRQDDIEGVARPRQRRLLLRLDAAAYKEDKQRAEAGKGDVLDGINLIIRRRQRENNFRATLETLKRLTLSENVPVPNWLQDVFLGYGDPASASYKRLPNRLKAVDYRDTFLDWNHLIESLPGKTVEPDPKFDASFPPPYVLETVGPAPEAAIPQPKSGKKRKREQPGGPESSGVAETVKVTTYRPPNTGPYPTNSPRRNGIRFTPSQIEAISSGTQPGLTLIVGPPGTGKTDVTTQIISNIYHNFPGQRTLLIAHSNQALNQLFTKITKLDIDARHLLRLGRGEEELELEASFSNIGRVEGFMERGAVLLGEVQRLAISIGAVGAHGASCENAQYFSQVFVQPRWRRFRDAVSTGEDIPSSFPFEEFFADVPQRLFPPTASREEHIEIARGCERHVNKMFEELSEIRPFELLRNQREKSNYLLVKEARIVAMTATHAAIRRQEIARLGFRYENVVMEEAAQITEAESFIPFVLQGGASGSAHGGLKRIVLVGDHNQNAPVIQNKAFADYANVEQSLFQRLIRLGVPHTVLDAQGRARPSLAKLVGWRYPALTNLPFTLTTPEFVQANAGFRYEYQFIDVPDYKGKGESEPSPHYLQNLGEAEYAVALYQYMRLLGYPAERISILAAYAGQRALIRDVLTHRCKGNRLFGMPGWVGTVDKYQGEENDYVILSLVRTKSPGYLRDLRRLTVALSRARLGLYVFGRKEVFESSLELREAFRLLFERPGKLALVTGEMFPSARGVEEDAEQSVAGMDGVEHLGQYVYEMTQAKVRAVKEGGGVLPPAASNTEGRVEEDGEGEGEEEGVEDVDGVDDEGLESVL